jgi:methionine synthase II (cobalamin-independent)
MPESFRSTKSEGVLKRAAAKAIQEQRDLGLDEWTGGEYHTDNFVMHMHKCLTGLEIDKPEAEDVFDYDDMTHAKVTGKISAPHGLGYLEAFRREKDLPGGVRKAAVVAPYEVIVAGRDQLDAITPQMPAITEVINSELRAMADEGCPNVQLDAPIFGAEVNMGMMTAQQAADLIAPCFEGVKAKRSLHFCNGNCAADRFRMRCTARRGSISCSASKASSISPLSRPNISFNISNATPSRRCRKACSLPPASSTKAVTGSSRSRRSASALPTGRVLLAKNVSGYRRPAALAAIPR